MLGLQHSEGGALLCGGGEGGCQGAPWGARGVSCRGQACPTGVSAGLTPTAGGREAGRPARRRFGPFSD